MHTNLIVTRRTAGLALAGAVLSLAFPGTGQPADHMNGEKDGGPAGLRACEEKAVLLKEGKVETAIWSLADGAAGPVIRAKVGERYSLAIYNDTPLPLSIHWHGMRIENSMDGAGGLTQAPILPGRYFHYRFTPTESGTYLFRPCVIGGTSEPAGRGITGFFIVEEALVPPADMHFNAIVNDWLLDGNGQLEAFVPMPMGRLGNILTVNGEQIPCSLGDPVATLPASRVRLRIANACNARSFRIRFDGLKAYVLAVDGRPTDAFEPLRSSLPFCPGNRYDVAFDIPADGPNAAVTALIGDGIPLITFKPRPQSRTVSTPIEPLPPNPTLPEKIRLQDATRPEFAIGVILSDSGTSPKAWTINDKRGQAGMAPAFSVRQGTPVVLTIRNETPVPQPIHVHGHCFRLLHPFDDGWDPFWMDTLAIPANTTVRIAFIAGLPGKWMIASTVCERFDAGLWGWFEVT